MRFIRIARVFRLLRLAKLARYSEALRTVINVGRRKKKELSVTLLVLSLLLVLASCLVYYVEHEAQPDQFSSIPASMWWAVATLTTVGYGDIYPVTVLGKVLASVIAILGIRMFGLPAGVLGAGFVAAGCPEGPSLRPLDLSLHRTLTHVPKSLTLNSRPLRPRDAVRQEPVTAPVVTRRDRGYPHRSRGIGSTT